MYQNAVRNGDGNCCRRRPISYYPIVIAGSVSDEFSALDQLHRDPRRPSVGAAACISGVSFLT